METAVVTNGMKIPEMRLRAHHFVNHTTVLYGPTGSGKTAFIKNIMKLTNGAIELILVVSPTEISNHAYEGFVHPALIHSNAWLPDPSRTKSISNDKKGTTRFLEAVWARQEIMTSIWVKANNQDVLRRLYARLGPALRARGDLTLRKIDTIFADRKEIAAKLDRARTRVLKHFIEKEADRLWGEIEDEHEDEKYSLQYLKLNPNLLLVFDDCASNFSPAVKSSAIMRKLFYQNRHASISVVFSCQDDTDLPANLRKNVYVSIYTSDVIAATNFNRPSNSYPQSIKTAVQNSLAAVFAKTHRKLLHIRDDATQQHIYHVTAEIPQPFMFGSRMLHRLCEEVEGDSTELDQTNQYWSLFRLI